MARAAQIGLIIAGIMNVLPLAGALGADQLRSLYGLASITPDLEILLRHRAILFGLVGSLLIAAAFVPGLQLAALLIGGASMASFIVIALLVGNLVPRSELSSWPTLSVSSPCPPQPSGSSPTGEGSAVCDTYPTRPGGRIRPSPLLSRERPTGSAHDGHLGLRHLRR